MPPLRQHHFLPLFLLHGRRLGPLACSSFTPAALLRASHASSSFFSHCLLLVARLRATSLLLLLGLQLTSLFPPQPTLLLLLFLVASPLPEMLQSSSSPHSAAVHLRSSLHAASLHGPCALTSSSRSCFCSYTSLSSCSWPHLRPSCSFFFLSHQRLQLLPSPYASPLQLLTSLSSFPLSCLSLTSPLLCPLSLLASSPTPSLLPLFFFPSFLLLLPVSPPSLFYFLHSAAPCRLSPLTPHPRCYLEPIPCSPEPATSLSPPLPAELP